MTTLDKARMGELHEIYLAEIFGGRKARGSGNQWDDPGDGRNDHTTQPFAFCWDGKSTTGTSITITEAMIAKIREQAGGERPAIGLRWYGNQVLTIVDEDWVLITAADMDELLAEARSSAAAAELAVPASYQLPGYVSPPGGRMEPRTVVYSNHATGGVLVNQGVRILPSGASELFRPDRVALDHGADGQQKFAVDDQIMTHADWYLDGVLKYTIG